MINDIVERLRAPATPSVSRKALRLEAAAEIERLQAALREIDDVAAIAQNEDDKRTAALIRIRGVIFSALSGKGES